MDPREAFDLAQQQAQDSLDEHSKVVEGPQLRVLCCFVCKTVETMPDYLGHPDNDVVLYTLLRPHGGESEMPHVGALMRVSQVVWDDRDARKQIIEGAFDQVTGFRPSYYDAKDTLKEDAVKCHIAHRRQIPCIDWQDRSKVLRAPTVSMRQKLAASLKSERNRIDLDKLAKGAPTQFLCDYCPVAMAVEYKKRQERGEV